MVSYSHIIIIIIIIIKIIVYLSTTFKNKVVKVRYTLYSILKYDKYNM